MKRLDERDEPGMTYDQGYFMHRLLAVLVSCAVLTSQADEQSARYEAHRQFDELVPACTFQAKWEGDDVLLPVALRKPVLGIVARAADAKIYEPILALAKHSAAMEQTACTAFATLLDN